MENSKDNRQRTPESLGEDIELMIDDYLDGRMDPIQRTRFEERMNREPELRDKVNSATRSVAMVQRALGWITPDDDFDHEINTKIISITQSGMHLPASERSLTSDDPEARLLGDPEAAREKRRLIFLGVAAALLFGLAAAIVIISILLKR